MSPAGSGRRGGQRSVRRARYDLARALLAESPPRRNEAVTQLQMATDEAGDEPPTWKLLARAAEALADTDPIEALAQFLRCFRFSTPAEFAHAVRKWVESLPPGTLRARTESVERLVTPHAGAAHRLLAARVHYALGDPTKAYETLRDIDDSDQRVCAPLHELEARCLIDLGRFDEASRVIEEDRVHDLGALRILLRARLAYAQGQFDEALAQLSRYPGEQSDELVEMRILAMVGVGRAYEVRWTPPEPDDRSGVATWLSRAVAALEAQRWDDAHQAVEWAERDQPGSLSVQLLKAQTRLERDDFASGQPMLKVVANRAGERGRDPYWLERQRQVRRFGRFGYVYCEFLHLCGRTDRDLLGAVDRSVTTYRQDGRLGEIEAATCPVGSVEWAAALDRAQADYTTAAAHDHAMDAAQRVFVESPTLDRALAAGWAVWNVSFRSERAEGGVPPDAADRLGPAIEAVERLLVAEDGRLEDAATFVAAARMRRIELLTSGVLAEGKDTLPWVLAIAVLQPMDVSAQLMAEWTLRRLYELPAASTEFAVHAGTLATSNADVTEMQLIARLNDVGVDDEGLRLLALLEAQHDALPDDGFGQDRAMWRNTVRLHAALVGDDDEQLTELLDLEVGTAGWVLERKAFATIRILGPAARPTLEKLAGALPVEPMAELTTRAWFAAFSGDFDGARNLIIEARAQGSTPNLGAEKAIFDYLAMRDRPLHEVVAEALRHARSPGGVQWMERVVLPWLVSTDGGGSREPGDELRALIESRRDELETEPDDWTDELRRADPVSGALAVLWRATVRRDPRALIAALHRLPEHRGGEPMRKVVHHLVQETNNRIPAHLLTDVVTTLAGGGEPDRALIAEVGARGDAPVADLAAVLTGIHGAAVDHEAVDAFATTVERCCTDTASLFRLLRAVEQRAPETSADPTLLMSSLIERIPIKLLDDVVDDLASGRHPNDTLVAEVHARVPTPLTGVAAALAGSPVAAVVADEHRSGEASEQQAVLQAFSAAVERHCPDSTAVWRVYDAVDAAGFAMSSVRAALTAATLDRLPVLLGLDAWAQPPSRSHVSFVLGEGFVPEDTGPGWVLFSTYIPQLRARVEDDTGYLMPGFHVRGDSTRLGSLDLCLYETVFETHDLPVDGCVALVTDFGPVSPRTVGRDPLGRGWAVHVPPGEPAPADAVEVWQPLEFALRHVEHFVRAHLADIVTVFDVLQIAALAGPQAQRDVADPVVMRRWLLELRRTLEAGAAFTPRGLASAIAEDMSPPLARPVRVR